MFTVIIGKRGCGKTSLAINMLVSGERGGRGLIVCGNAAEVETYRSSDAAEGAEVVLEQDFEDMQVPRNRSFAVMDSCGYKSTQLRLDLAFNSKHRGVKTSIIVMESGAEATESIPSNADRVIMFRTDDPVERRRLFRAFGQSLFPNIDAFNRIMDAMKAYEYMSIDTDTRTWDLAGGEQNQQQEQQQTWTQWMTSFIW